MADDVTIVDGLGANQSVATDQVVDATLGTAHVQYTKLMDGTLGGTNKSVINASGDLSVSEVQVRRLQEQAYLQQYAAQQSLYDLSRGFEVR